MEIDYAETISPVPVSRGVSVGAIGPDSFGRSSVVKHFAHARR
jgi:hypothetical protein